MLKSKKQELYPIHRGVWGILAQKLAHTLCIHTHLLSSTLAISNATSNFWALPPSSQCTFLLTVHYISSGRSAWTSWCVCMKVEGKTARLRASFGCSAEGLFKKMFSVQDLSLLIRKKQTIKDTTMDKQAQLTHRSRCWVHCSATVEIIVDYYVFS